MLQLEFCSWNWSLLLWWALNQNTLCWVPHTLADTCDLQIRSSRFSYLSRVSVSRIDASPWKVLHSDYCVWRKKKLHSVLFHILQSLFDFLLVSLLLSATCTSRGRSASFHFVLCCVACHKLTLSLHFARAPLTKPLATSHWFKG